jgi:hypothetical protein
MRIKQLGFVIALVSITTLFSCSDTSNSGPCDYTQEKFNMRIIDVLEDPENENMFIVQVDFDGNVSYADQSLTLGEVRNVETNLDFVVRNNIKPGNIYSGTAHIKVEGTGECEDQIIDWDQKLRK